MTETETGPDALALRRKRIRYRAHHRGIQEMDIILGGYADTRLAAMDEDMLERLERLMDAPDVDLFAWISGQSPLPPEADRDLVTAIRRFQLERGGAR